MKKVLFLTFLFAIMSASALFSQTNVITGTVKSSIESEGPIIGATVFVKGTTTGTITGIDGKYSLSVPQNATTLIFSYIGMKKLEVEVAGRNVLDITMEPDVLGLNEVVVTALGISREKKSLGYSVQEVKGDNISKTKESNFVNSLSGKVSGVQIIQSNTMGGSANILIRGNKSLMNSNQALFVVDGVPLDNSTNNTTLQVNGNGGYDYGNAAADINPDDVESMSVLKGAAATALYGSRAANGVVMITTKKGVARKGIGVAVSAGLMFSKIDRKTLPKMQKEYGGGYGAGYEDASGYFWEADLNGDGTNELIVPASEDASWGAKFDPSLMVIDWVGLEPTDAEHYLKPVPWVAAEHDIKDFFETGIKQNYNIAFDGGNDKGTFRLSYTNLTEKGILPNSEIKKNIFNFNGTYNFTSKLSVESNVSYINDNTKGRYGTGYDPGNPMQSLGQWFQANVDIEDLKNYQITPDGRQRTWNYAYYDDLTPIFHNNIYWTRNMNYENDGRDRIFGYSTLRYKLAPWITLEGRVATDYYSQFQEERVAVYSNQTSLYTKTLRNFSETNMDFMAKINKSFGEFSLNGLFGTNRRRTTIKATTLSTNGGLIVPGLYNLFNSRSPILSTESERLSGVNSVFGNLSVGYKNLVYLDLSGRNDISSTLPSGNHSYFYPSASTSFIISELPGIKGSKVFSFMKLRLNYAEVGNDAPIYSLFSTYPQKANWETNGRFYVNRILPNPSLKPERTKSIEAGLETKLMNNRFGFDLSLYKTNSIDQIMPVNISRASGYNQRYVNSGEIENKGIEFSLTATVIKARNFSWDLQANWFKNVNTVKSLYEGVDNIILSTSWDVSTNIVVGQPYGMLRGTNFVYTNGKRTVDADGWYLIGDDPSAILGSTLPDWNAGITSIFNYKNFSLSALIDISKGGNLYSVDMMYGLATGIFEETAGLNDKGKPKRDPVADGGGIRYDAVYEDGTPNTSYIWAGDWDGAWQYDYLPTAAYVYDASYVKLRELALSYNLPSKLLAKTPVSRVTVSVVGRNLWMIHSNIPNYDPELSLSAGNIQGIADGAYPSTRTFGFNISVGF
jgi:TonB-linked SusC/RagA family outer membrane protein